MELIYIIIHGGMHHWGRLKWLLDVKLYLEKGSLDWDQFDILVKRLRVGRMIALYNKMLQEFFLVHRNCHIQSHCLARDMAKSTTYGRGY